MVMVAGLLLIGEPVYVDDGALRLVRAAELGEAPHGAAVVLDAELSLDRLPVEQQRVVDPDDAALLRLGEDRLVVHLVLLVVETDRFGGPSKCLVEAGKAAHREPDALGDL